MSTQNSLYPFAHVELAEKSLSACAMGNMKPGKRERNGPEDAGELQAIKTRRLSSVSKKRKSSDDHHSDHENEGNGNEDVVEEATSAEKNGVTPGGGAGSGRSRKTPAVPMETYTIPGTRKVVKAGDTVLIQAPEREKPPYVARIEKIEKVRRRKKEQTVVRVRWFYHPEETISRRQSFHGEQEICLSDHYDIQDADCIQDKCTVHTFKDYCKLKEVDSHDFFWRFEYKASSQQLTPDVVDVYCVCELPYNPDHFMVQCESCSNWFHPACIGMSKEKVASMETYVCADCSQ
ncbi:hypothetical protein R1sor_016043 [Riccia sorocarpa]|uniref:Uncharacterized protein n=1 Tax=Riccia sorocarpa TaxID=122646 RepID=A0ABD3HK27_9MARC